MKKADFEQLQQAAEQLNWQEELYELQELEQTAEAKTFFVAFVGCYSAGKSCLINNLLGRELLPHGTTETTTVLTYLRYAEEEKACLHKIDGSTQEISLEEVGSVDQRRENWNPDELDYLEVFVNSPLLQSGMILMDTPGINTTILRHEQLLQKTLAVAARVVYVMSGTPSRVDCGLLQEMQQRGLKPACVRTHFDQVKQQEENAEQTMQADCTRLADYGVEQCYFVSNLRESPYYENLTPLQTMLTECGSNAQEELENAIRMRLYVLAERCEKELEQRIEVLGKLDQKNQSAVQEKCEELRAQIEALEQGAQAREEEIVNRLRQAQRKLDSTVTRKMEADLEESAGRGQKTVGAAELGNRRSGHQCSPADERGAEKHAGRAETGSYARDDGGRPYYPAEQAKRRGGRASAGAYPAEAEPPAAGTGIAGGGSGRAERGAGPCGRKTECGPAESEQQRALCPCDAGTAYRRKTAL